MDRSLDMPLIDFSESELDEYQDDLGENNENSNDNDNIGENEENDNENTDGGEGRVENEENGNGQIMAPFQFNQYAENLMHVFNQRYGDKILQSLNKLNKAAAALSRVNQKDIEAAELPKGMPFRTIKEFNLLEKNDEARIQLTLYLKTLGGSKKDVNSTISSYWKVSFHPLQQVTGQLIWRETKGSCYEKRILIPSTKFYRACKDAYRAVVGRDSFDEKSFKSCMQKACKTLKVGTANKLKKYSKRRK